MAGEPFLRASADGTDLGQRCSPQTCRGPIALPFGAGCGRFLAVALADRLERSYRDFADLTPCADDAHEMVARCAPAAAVARLA